MTTNGLPGLPLPSNRTALIVDDTDSNVVYTPPEAWFFQISSNRQYNSSRTGTNSTGAQAQFEFEGTGIEVWGTVGSWDVYGVPLSTYSIDNGPQVSYSAPVVDPGFVRAPIQYYQSPKLSNARHILTITNVNGTAPSLLWIDYFVYTPDPGALASSSTRASGSSTSSVPSTTSSDIPIKTTSSHSSGSKTNIGAIAGGVVGGVIGLAFFLILGWLCLRRRRQRNERIVFTDNQRGVLTSEIASGALATAGSAVYDNSQERYQTHSVMQGMESNTISGQTGNSSSYNVPIVGLPPSSRRKGAPSSQPSEASTFLRTNGIPTPLTEPTSSSVHSTAQQEVPVQHQDSGIRVRDIPPVYTQE